MDSKSNFRLSPMTHHLLVPRWASKPNTSRQQKLWLQKSVETNTTDTDNTIRIQTNIRTHHIDDFSWINGIKADYDQAETLLNLCFSKQDPPENWSTKPPPKHGFKVTIPFAASNEYFYDAPSNRLFVTRDNSSIFIGWNNEIMDKYDSTAGIAIMPIMFTDTNEGLKVVAQKDDDANQPTSPFVINTQCGGRENFMMNARGLSLHRWYYGKLRLVIKHMWTNRNNLGKYSNHKHKPNT